MRRYSLVLSLSFCFPFEYVKILRFIPKLSKRDSDGEIERSRYRGGSGGLA